MDDKDIAAFERVIRLAERMIDKSAEPPSAKIAVADGFASLDKLRRHHRTDIHEGDVIAALMRTPLPGADEDMADFRDRSSDWYEQYYRPAMLARAVEPGESYRDMVLRKIARLEDIAGEATGLTKQGAGKLKTLKGLEGEFARNVGAGKTAQPL